MEHGVIKQLFHALFGQQSNYGHSVLWTNQHTISSAWHWLSHAIVHIVHNWSSNASWDDGWMDDLRFYVLFNSISYQDDVWTIMKGCVQWNSVYGREDFTSSEDRTQSARSVGKRLTHWATRAPILGRPIIHYRMRLPERHEIKVTCWWQHRKVSAMKGIYTLK